MLSRLGGSQQVVISQPDEIGNEDAVHGKLGELKVYPSPRPTGTTTIFMGAGDDVTPGAEVVGGGPRLLWDMQANGDSIAIDLQFTEVIYMKDGYIICENAPFGAYLDAEIVHPVYGVVGAFARKVPVFGSGWFPLDSEDRGELAQGLTLRLTMYNADTPAAFKAAGRLELYRATTV